MSDAPMPDAIEGPGEPGTPEQPGESGDLDVLANLRDAGAVLRAGVLYRSEAPQPWDRPPSSDGAPLVWPPRTVLDLREPHERPAVHPLAGPSTSVVALSVMAALEPGRTDIDLAERYVAGVSNADRWLPALVSTAATAPSPVLVHCAAGKDRTGIAVAVLLRLAGASRADVIADFLLTAPALDTVHARLERAQPGRTVSPAVSAVRQDAIEGVLDALGEPDDAWALAVRAGVAEADLAAWRVRMGR